MPNLTRSSSTANPNVGVPQCHLDAAVVNAETLPAMKDVALSIFAPACGRNRGAFVLNPSDGHTYGCTKLPPSFCSLAGIDASTFPKGFALKDANSISNGFAAGNLTAVQTIRALDTLVQLVYNSTPQVDADPYACEVSGLAQLTCEPQLSASKKIRAVTLAGVFVHAPGISERALTMEQARGFYTAEDFKAMEAIDINAVQIPVPADIFADKEQLDLLTTLVGQAKEEELDVIVVLVESSSDKGNTEKDTSTAMIASAARYAVAQGLHGLTLPSIAAHATARAAAGADLVLFLPLSLDVQHMPKNFPLDDPRAVAALSVAKVSSVADVASSSKSDDRQKLFYHEATTCLLRSPLEFLSCYKNLPAMVGQGFDLSIDDCVLNQEKDFVDYGQCSHFEATMESPWWHRHRASLLARQLASYEQGMGWSFSSWKLFNSTATGVLDSPAKLLSLSDVVEADLWPKKKSSIKLACLNPPESDFALGDHTVAPTAGPPPDCGDGWWNATTLQCDFWIPPQPTPAPTLPPPVIVVEQETNYTAVGGAAILGAALVALWTRFRSNGRSTYDAVPDASLTV